MNIGIVSAIFNQDITDPMAEGAEAQINERGHTHAATLRVPGAFDTPLATQRLLQRGDVDGVVVIGCVITGETDHDQVLMHATARTLQDLTLTHDKPVTLSITGPGMNRAQAEARIDYARQGVDSLIALQAALDGKELASLDQASH